MREPTAAAIVPHPTWQPYLRVAELVHVHDRQLPKQRRVAFYGVRKLLDSEIIVAEIRWASRDRVFALFHIPPRAAASNAGRAAGGEYLVDVAPHQEACSAPGRTESKDRPFGLAEDEASLTALRIAVVVGLTWAFGAALQLFT